MDYLSEAFKQLEILNEDVFDLDKDGLEDLRDFQDEDEEEVIDVIDPEAETEEDLEDSYIGKVILDCSVCHTDIYKDKEDVIIDEETELANVGEECPYCFSIDGFKVIGEVKPFVETEFETEDDVEVKVDGEEVEEEEEDEEKNESLKRKQRMVEAVSRRRNRKSLTEAPIYGLEPRYDARKSFYGKAQVDTGDKGDKNKLYSYGTLVAEIKDGKPVVYGTYSATTLRHIKDWLKQNGFRADTSKQIVADYGVKDEACSGRKSMKESSGEVFRNDNGKEYTVVERSRSGKNALLNRGGQWIIAWNCPKDSGSWGQGHYFFDEDEAREWWNKKYIKESKTPVKISRKSLKEGWDTKAVERFLKGAVKDIMDEKGTCATMKLDNRLAICVGWSDGYYDDDDSVIHAENDPEWGMNAGIKVWTSDSMRTDFDYINAPYNKDTGDVWDTSVSISPDEDYASLASYFEEEYDKMKEYEIEKDGKIVGKWDEDEGEEEFESLNRKSLGEGIFGGNLPDVVMMVKHGSKDAWTPMACIKDKKNMSLMQKRKKEYLDDFDDAEVKFISGKEAKKLDKKFNTNGIDVLDESLNELFGKKEKAAAVLIVRHGKGSWDALSGVKDRKNIRMLQDHQKEYMNKFDDAEAKIVSWDDAKKINKKLTIDDLHIFDESLTELFGKDELAAVMFVRHGKGSWDALSGVKDRKNMSMLQKHKQEYLDKFDDAEVKIVSWKDAKKLDKKLKPSSLHIFDESLDRKPRKARKMKESIEDITIDTGDQEITVSAKDKEEIESEDEMIAPISDETKDEIETNSEETEEENGDEVDVDMDEFSEEEFDDLGESYLKKVYENVDSYKTTSVSEKGNKIKVEGLIKFTSGKTKKTSFVFEAKTIDKSGHAKFLGENLQISRGHKSFKLSGTISNNKFIAESLNYNYRAKSGKSSQRVYGTVRVNKK